MPAGAMMMRATQRDQLHRRCIRSRRSVKSQVTAAARRPGRPRGTAGPHAAPQAARVHANCRMMHQMQFCPSRAAVMNAYRRVCGLTCLAIPACRATRRTTRAAPPVQPLPACGGEQRSFSALADGQADRPGRPRRERDSDATLPPLRVMTRVRWPRSRSAASSYRSVTVAPCHVRVPKGSEIRCMVIADRTSTWPRSHLAAQPRPHDGLLGSE